MMRFLLAIATIYTSIVRAEPEIRNLPTNHGPLMTQCMRDDLGLDCPDLKLRDSMAKAIGSGNSKEGIPNISNKSLSQALLESSELAPVKRISSESEESGPIEDKVIYGNDDRKEPFEVSEVWKTRARSSVALVRTSRLTNRGDYFTYTTTSFQNSQNLCSSERFAQQNVLPFCTGFLVAPDVVVTAGHCITSQADCERTSFVFDYGIYNQGESQAPSQIPTSKVYTCKTIKGRALGGNFDPDFAVIQLDRPVCDRDSLPLSTTRATRNTPLVMIGHPSGLPTKVADGASVRQLYTHFFDANTDSYAGNSGSPVFNSNNGRILGILVRGETDFVTATNNTCKVSNRCTNSGCIGEDATYIEKVLAMSSSATKCETGASVTNSADYGDRTAPGSIATIFSRGILNGSSEIIQSQTKPLPQVLGSVSVTVDGLNAGLFLVTDSQINIQIPTALYANDFEAREYEVKILKNGNLIRTGKVKVYSNAPALFTFASRGDGGTALGQALIVNGETRSYLDLSDSLGTPAKIPVGKSPNLTIVSLYGTGIKSQKLQDYEVHIDGVWSKLDYAGPVGGSETASPFTGLDQINVTIPSALVGRGQVALVIRHIPSQSVSKRALLNLGDSF